ncbi:MAG: multicopper oxidase domain-containing protein [Candidatus Acidiferrum sp.]
MKTMLIRFIAGRRFAIAGCVSFGGTVKSRHCAVALQRAVCLLALFCWGSSLRGQAPAGKTRTYYVAADEVNWDYAPTGRDEAMGHPFDALQKGYTDSGPHRIGRIYKKAIYREYTDDTFTTLKERSAEGAYLGLLGPILRAEVGDTIKVVFKNKATHPFSMHPHGVLYQKDSEGADYNDGTSGADESDGAVPPGETHTYVWQVPERAGPGPNDPSSVFWLYHSHADELRDVASGLFGVIVVTRRGMALPDGRPKDVDREFVTMFVALNENESWYLEDNIRDHTTDPKGVDRTDFSQVTPEGIVVSFPVTGFGGTNVKSSINGYIFGNMPLMKMKAGDRVRWYVTTLGDFNNAHSPHWHGNTVMVGGQRTDVLSVLSAQMITADMVPDMPGIWLYHCHISDHMLAGMVARYQVTPR